MAMAACTYLANDTQSHLLMAKSKVSDVKRQTTIPKLELNAITIGTRLSLNVLQSLKSAVHIDRILIVSDSEIALKWVSSPVRRSNGVYVTNRVKEVQKLARQMESSKTSIAFGYIDTSRNPADCATRGIQCNDFLRHKWWTGYSLKQIEEEKIVVDCRTVPGEEGDDLCDTEEVRMHPATVVQEETLCEILDLRAQGSFTKAKRITAYALRFLKGVTSRLQGQLQCKLLSHLPWLGNTIRGGHLSARDILDAQHVIFRGLEIPSEEDICRLEISLTRSMFSYEIIK
ncbi:unnamed protein product [Nippostrongylus brasiliensis]|uniref:RNase H domain-containing protein n=1 Tax=Nippostrongylus brasiliensis TaxID=27835 RepID=A0A0N4YDX5_NIPBR|nr:unnamed protein product [Nippostrongylus brasiliensis]